MLSMHVPGALWFKIEINGNLWGHRSYRVYFRPEISSKKTSTSWHIMAFCFSTSCQVKRTCCTYLSLQIVMEVLENKQGLI